MQPARKRKIRLIVALSAAVVLATALVVTSFSASSEAVSPSALATARAGVAYQRNGSASVPVTYTGAVPDAFREGREVIVTVRKEGTTFVGERDSLITKCPSKFTEDATRRT
jgi:cytochrome c-type biogenesis protein CcmE